MASQRELGSALSFSRALLGVRKGVRKHVLQHVLPTLAISLQDVEDCAQRRL